MVEVLTVPVAAWELVEVFTVPVAVWKLVEVLLVESVEFARPPPLAGIAVSLGRQTWLLTAANC